MTKLELIDQLANHNRLGSKAAATEVLDELLAIITDTVASGDSVYLGQNFGGFSVVKRAAKTGKVNGTDYSVPERNAIKFKPSKELKSAVSK